MQISGFDMWKYLRYVMRKEEQERTRADGERELSDQYKAQLAAGGPRTRRCLCSRLQRCPTAAFSTSASSRDSINTSSVGTGRSSSTCFGMCQARGDTRQGGAARLGGLLCRIVAVPELSQELPSRVQRGFDTRGRTGPAGTERQPYKPTSRTNCCLSPQKLFQYTLTLQTSRHNSVYRRRWQVPHRTRFCMLCVTVRWTRSPSVQKLTNGSQTGRLIWAS